jgi:hypothetical protein
LARFGDRFRAALAALRTRFEPSNIVSIYAVVVCRVARVDGVAATAYVRRDAAAAREATTHRTLLAAADK